MRDFFHHLFVPRESNNHRARLLHIEPLAFLLFLLFLMNILTPRMERLYPQVLGITANVSITDLVTLTNNKRAEGGLPPLILDNQLSVAAAAKAEHMFSHNYWAHTAPDGTTPWFFIRGAGYEYLYAGENLARGFTTAPEAVDAWMASPGHRNNIMSPNYKDIGFAVLTGTLAGDETVLIVEMFGSKIETTAAINAQSQQIAIVPPTPTIQNIFLSPTPFTPQLIVTPTVGITVTPTPVVQRQKLAPQLPVVAAIRSNPLINSDILNRSVSVLFAALLIAVFIVDMLVVERKKIMRFVSHNTDHILFLIMVITLLFILGRGVIL